MCLSRFLFNVPLIATSAGGEQSGFFIFFFLLALCVVPVCGVTSLSWKEKGRNIFRKEKRKSEKCNKAAEAHRQGLAEPLFATHRLRYATVHSKYNEAWLKQTQRKFGLVIPHDSFAFSSLCCQFSAALLLSLQFNINLNPRLMSFSLFYSLFFFSSSVYLDGIN